MTAPRSFCCIVTLAWVQGEGCGGITYSAETWRSVVEMHPIDSRQQLVDRVLVEARRELGAPFGSTVQFLYLEPNDL